MPNLRTWEVEVKNQPQLLVSPHEAQAQNKNDLVGIFLFFKLEAQGWEYGSVVE